TVLPIFSSNSWWTLYAFLPGGPNVPSVSGQAPRSWWTPEASGSALPIIPFDNRYIHLILAGEIWSDSCFGAMRSASGAVGFLQSGSSLGRSAQRTNCERCSSKAEDRESILPALSDAKE